MAAICKPCKVTGLSTLVNLDALCQKEGLTLSQDTRNAILYDVVKRIGPNTADKVVKKLVELGELEKESIEYEVESILKKRYNSKSARDEYWVKWKRWPHSCNTWEPLENLHNCEAALEEFKMQKNTRGLKRKMYRQQDDDVTDIVKEKIEDAFTKIIKCERKFTPDSLLELTKSTVPKLSPSRIFRTSRGHRPAKAWATNKRSKAYKEHRDSVNEALKIWEQEINRVKSECVPLKVENDVDLEGPPETFKFVEDYIPTAGVIIDSDPKCGCDCGENNCCASSGSCCPHNSGASFAYTMGKRVRLPVASAIYECNKLCTCGSDCRNRVVQHGRQVKLSIFRTKNGCGWGVKTRQKIKKGTFIMEYLGEIITNETAEIRGQKYDAEGFTYLFDLDFNDDDCPFTIDARNYGNESHFVNHSCEPNMSVYGVWINNLDVRLPRISLFANRDIFRDEELTFDYKMTGDTTIDDEGMLAEQSIRRTPNKMSPFKTYKRPSGITPTKCTNLGFREAQTSSETEQEEDVEVDVTLVEEEQLPEQSVHKSQVFDTDAANINSKITNEDKNEKPLSNGYLPGAEPTLPAKNVSFMTEEVKMSSDETDSSLKASDKLPAISQGEAFPNDTSQAAISLSSTSSLPSKEAIKEMSHADNTSEGDSLLITGQLSNEDSAAVKYGKQWRNSQDFSCKNHRIVCHCGSKKCRGFLF